MDSTQRQSHQKLKPRSYQNTSVSAESPLSPSVGIVRRMTSVKTEQQHDHQSFSNKNLDIDTTDRRTRRVIAPYVKIHRKSRLQSDKEKDSQKFSFFLENRPTVLLQDVSTLLSDNVDLASVLQETGDILKLTTKASGMAVYFVDASADEIYQVPKLATDSAHKVNWKIQKGSTVAAYVAYRKEFVMIDDILGDDRFPLGLGYTDKLTSAVLCVPILTTDNDVCAILELYKIVPTGPFSEDDLKITMVVSGWMGAAIHQNRQRVALQKQQELNDYLLDLIKCYFADNVPLEKLISEIVKFAKLTLGAQRGTFFIIDQDCPELTAEVFEEGINTNNIEETTMHKKNIKLRLLRDKSIPGLVARTGVTVNLRDAYNDSKFFTEVEPKTGFITRSILCMPILSVDSILGVVQVVNKQNGVTFTPSDETLFKTFSVYCALALHYARMSKRMRRTHLLYEQRLDLLNLQIKPCIHDITVFERNIEPRLPAGFNEFKWYVSPEEEPIMPQMAYFMIKTIVGFDHIDAYVLRNFILSVRKCYRNNPYHNWEHAFNVGHCMYNILARNMEMFNDIEIKSLVIACICHDLDHGGYTNNFLQLNDSYLSQLYDESFLENHHFGVAMLIYKVFPFYTVPDKIFHSISTEIRNCIIATDLANYFKVRLKLTQIRNNTGLDWQNRQHKTLCKAIMMTMSDLSGSCKPYLTAKVLTENLLKEFYNQGDQEKTMGLMPLSMMDREKAAQIPEDQVNFLNIIVIPCAEMLKNFLPNCGDLLTEATTLRTAWQEIIDLKGKKSWRQVDSTVYQND